MKYFQDRFLENSDKIKISSTDKELKNRFGIFKCLYSNAAVVKWK